MPNPLMLILPLIAIAFWGYIVLPQIYALCKYTRLNQTIWGDGKSTRKAAFDRGQRDEYETLLALGFIPLGAYQESIWRVCDGTEQYAFTHRDLPIVCSLCQNINQELFVVLTTDDLSGRTVRTSSSTDGVQLDTPDCFAHCVEAETFEQVFVAHVRVLDQWEQIGFEPTRSETLEEVKLHYRRTFENPAIQKLMCQNHANVLNAFIMLGLMLPGILVTVVGAHVAPMFQINWSFSLAAQIVAVMSLAGTYYLFRKLDFSKVPAKNSIGGHQGTLPAQPTQDERAIESTPPASLLQQNASPNQQWNLPYRTADTAKVPAFFAILWVLGSVAVLYFHAEKILQNVPVAFLLLTAVVCIAAGLAAWASAIALGRSWHQIEVDENHIRSTEKAWWFWLTRKRPVTEIESIKLDPMVRHPDIAMGIFHHEGGQPSHVIAVCLEDTSEFRVAFGYSKEVLEPLAFQLADAIGLPASSVRIRNAKTELEPRAQTALEETILEESQDLASEMEAALNVSYATPSAHNDESFEFTNAAWGRGRGSFFAWTGSVFALAAAAMWFNGVDLGYLIFIAFAMPNLFSLKRIQKLLPFRTLVKVASNRITLTRQTLIQNDSVVVDGHNCFHFEDVVEFKLFGVRAGGKALIAYLSGKPKVILTDSRLGFSIPDIEALAECSQARLLSYRQAKRTNNAGSLLAARQPTET